MMGLGMMGFGIGSGKAFSWLGFLLFFGKRYKVRKIFGQEKYCSVTFVANPANL